MTGKISNIISDKKFGFISGEDGLEYFFHKSDVLEDRFDSLSALFRSHGGGVVRVSFDTDRTTKGPRARDVAELT